MAAADAAKNGSEIDRAARDAGVDTAEVERWLEQILDAWRQSTSDQPVEPWSFSFQGAEADRLLAAAIPRASLQPIDQRFYKDLGADLKQLGASVTAPSETLARCCRIFWDGPRRLRPC